MIAKVRIVKVENFLVIKYSCESLIVKKRKRKSKLPMMGLGNAVDY